MALSEDRDSAWAKVCALCGIGMVGHRSDARFCSDPCRVEASRLSRLLAGEAVGPYSSIRRRPPASGA